MKLLTELRQDPDGTWYAIDPDPYQVAGAVARDAAAAHALMRATDTLSARGPFVEPSDWVYAESERLMRSWGFDSGEVE